MLNIINNLKPFYEDCYRRINIREYSRIMKISAPTASKILFKMNKQGLLNLEKERNYLFFYANKENKNFIDFSRIYWRNKFNELLDFLNKQLTSPTIILFGSLSKAEAKSDSDIDLAIFSNKKNINLEKFEEILKRKIQILWFESITKIENKELANNIINGYILKGKLKQ
jgi:predicted nucleotidyltransferase